MRSGIRAILGILTDRFRRPGVDVYGPIDLERLVRRDRLVPPFRRRRLSPLVRVPLVVSGVLLGVAALIVSTDKVRWVGSTALEVRFIVTDARSGAPVDGARVFIHQEEFGHGYCESCRDSKDFLLTTGPDGTATHWCQGCMCSGTSSIWSSSVSVRVPNWRYSVSAQGHFDCANVWLQESPYGRQGKWRKKDAALDVPIFLEPTAP
jgi:hypothetical protein